MALKTTSSVWKDSQLADCSCESHYIYPSIIHHTHYEVRNARNFIIVCAKLPSAYAGSLVRSGSGSLNDRISHVLGQVDFVTALNFCLSLSLPPPSLILKLSLELVNFLQEALKKGGGKTKLK